MTARPGWKDVDCEPWDATAVRIPLRGQGGEVRAWARVDAADAERVRVHRWHLDSYGYAIAHVGKGSARRTVLMHRFVLIAPVGVSVDHRNRVKLDNRKRNLRLATH